MSKNLLLPLLLVTVACTGAEDDGVVPIPVEDSEDWEDTGSSTFPIDTNPDSGLDISPEHTLTLEQWGRWELSPFGGPYERLVGELHVWEYLDGVRPDTGIETGLDTGLSEEEALLCDLTWSLIGDVAEVACDDCLFAFDVEFFLVEGDASTCRDPDMPEEGEVRRYGYDTDGVIWHDYGGSGVWLPWFVAERNGDTITFSWLLTLGVGLEEEEDE